MKKILLSFMLVCSFILGNAQVSLNELYVLPKEPKNGAPGTNEFFELYYSGGLAVGESVDCWTMVTFWVSGANKGVYVMDLPSGVLTPPDRYYVGASSDPFEAQGNLTNSPDFNWNSPAFRSGSTGGYLKSYQVDAVGTGYLTPTDPPTDFNDFMSTSTGEYVVLIFVNGQFENGFIGGDPSRILPLDLQAFPDLLVPSGSAACLPFTIDFSTLGALEGATPQAGSDNGYNRTQDGKCGSWTKSSSSSEHTPGRTNNTPGAPLIPGELTTAQFINCDVPRSVSARVTAISGSITIADDFPVEITIYADMNGNGIVDGADGGSIAPTYEQNDLSSPALVAVTPFPNKQHLVTYRTARGCFDKVVVILNECIPLPVKFKTFNANRQNASTVGVSWTTASEQNNKGFNVQSNIGGVWKTIAFVPSQALNGTSSADLSYSFTDANNEKGITQYRIQQVDLDGKFVYTDIRAIRGEGSIGKVIVYPNPSVDGKFNVVFEDKTGVRDVYVNDMQGKIVKSYKGITNNILVIDRLTSGFYTIKITNRSTAASSVEKVVVK